MAWIDLNGLPCDVLIPIIHERSDYFEEPESRLQNMLDLQPFFLILTPQSVLAFFLLFIPLSTFNYGLVD